MANKNTEPIAVIRNPNSTDAAHAGEAIAQLDRHGVAHIDFMTSSADFDQNVAEIRDFLGSLPNEEERIVMSVAGDGTAAQVANAILQNRTAERQQGKRETPVKLGFLRYGGFGDIDHAHDIDGHDIMDVINAPTIDRYPLSVEVNGKLARHALAYVTLGFTAKAADQFATPKSRAVMQRAPRKLKPLLQVGQLGWSYFKYSTKRLPAFAINDEPHIYDTSTDIIIANNPYVGGLIKPVETYYDKPYFGYRADLDVSRINLSNVKFGVDALLGRAQFERTETMRIAFEQAANVLLHNEGEVEEHKDVQTVFVYKDPANVIKTLHPRGR